MTLSSATPRNELSSLLPLIQEVHATIRAAVVDACEKQYAQALSRVARDDAGDTIYAIDLVSEELLIECLEARAQELGGLVLVAEGLADGKMTLPRGQSEESARWRLIVDPIDGTRGLMYQKRSAWILTGVAPNKGNLTNLADLELSVQTEIPLVKQHLSDQLWAFKGRGCHGLRYNRLTTNTETLRIVPSRTATLEHGFAQVARYFPGARDELAKIDEELTLRSVGPPETGKAACFEDQYASTGGQLYELAIGHDRFTADLRPLLAPLLAQRGLNMGLCCHPYDLAGLLVATEAGVEVTDPSGAPLRAPLDVESDVAWIGYANRTLREHLEPILQSILRERGWLARAASNDTRKT